LIGKISQKKVDKNEDYSSKNEVKKLDYLSLEIRGKNRDFLIWFSFVCMEK